ncbi:MAG: hypothetical protein GQ559_11910 [Desulfobulbaceae bacterium]|nr:hypothetical protein [Desulfobulbaceae bacterium]
MRLTRKGKEGRFYFVVEQQPDEVPGGEVEICVNSSHEGEGILELRRTLYFDEQSPQHIDNFFGNFPMMTITVKFVSGGLPIGCELHAFIS